MNAFPKPDHPDVAFWKREAPAMRLAAKDEYYRLIRQARQQMKNTRDGRRLVYREVKPKQGPPFYDVIVMIPGKGTRRPEIIGIKGFSKPEWAERFINFALSDQPIPERKNPNVRP